MQTQSTPVLLRAATVATVIVALLFALLASMGVQRRQRGLDDAGDAARRLIQVQEVRVAIVAADSIASTNYLRGGLELASARQAFDDNIQRASAGLAKAGEGLDDAAARPVAQANSDLSAYTGLIEQARANNRQGFPVGAAYQRQANALLTSSALPALDQVEASLRDQVNQRMATAGRSGVWFSVAALVLLAVLLGGLAWHARRFKRLLNIPLAAATALVAVVGIYGLVGQASSISKANDAVRGPLQAADLAAQTRAALFDGRSQEALTLINRGNGAAFEANWQQAMATADLAADQACRRSPLGCDLQGALDPYRSAHQAMRTLDDQGDWDTAVAAALGATNVDSTKIDSTEIVGSFDAADQQAQRAVESNVERATSALSDAAAPLGALRWLTLVAGLAVAVLAVIGFGQRSREYR
ncbi:MAG TPA: hypothetical protein PKV27_07350 [Ilumatobacteraceae bacterium]|nr:hypothetical protein [Ilumatobacteraceae bacterium]